MLGVIPSAARRLRGERNLSWNKAKRDPSSLRLLGMTTVGWRCARDGNVECSLVRDDGVGGDGVRYYKHCGVRFFVAIDEPWSLARLLRKVRRKVT